jgi:predicted DCC family thiol-disulfide oxidoreductase YuxK
MNQPLILFDGVCTFCNASVHFIIDRDPQSFFRFTPLQGSTGQETLKRYNLSLNQLDTMLLVEDNQVHTRSTAALRIARHLRFPWNLLSVFLLVPPVIRNAVYGVIAQNRYKWFGQEDACRIPTPELRARFLN